jgi:cytochrome c heme-lyase
MHQRQPPPEPQCPSKSGQACPYPPLDKTPAGTTTSPSAGALNPLNYMPNDLSNAPAPSQSTVLPQSREASTIPRGDGTGQTWEYPSPQQMYNAMLRKGYEDTPTDAVEAMVAVHNFLNEGAWAEILEWERRFGGGLARAWRACSRGEAGSVLSPGSPSEGRWGEDRAAPQLARLMGRPGDLTPKARMLQAAAWAFPARYNGELPFDRHDWFVKRDLPDGSHQEVRYVIDYYSAPPDPNGEPVFYLDVRPAVDSPAAVVWRAMRWGGDLWYRGMGVEAREAAREAARKAKPDDVD